METYFVVKGVSIKEISPVAYDKNGNLLLGVGKQGRLYVKEELVNLINGTPFKIAISNKKIAKEELEDLIGVISNFYKY